MDIWLDDAEIQKLVQELNPELQKGRDYDANWEKLKRERVNPFDKVVKTQSPTLLEHERNFSFLYRRFDGAQWHTELREVDTLYRKVGFTSEQKRLKENIDTIQVLTDTNFNFVWITPTVKDTGQLDPTYQLIKFNNEWLCWIKGAIYSISNSRQQPNREYKEHTFSTRKQPVFTLESTEAILDRIVK